MSRVAVNPGDVAQWALPRQNTAPLEGTWIKPATLLAVVALLTIFEGAGRKWLFPNNAPLRYLAYYSKDIVFMLLAYWGYTNDRRFDLRWIVWCGFLILVPCAIPTTSNSNIVGMWLSFRAYLLIPLCAFLASPLLSNFRDIERCALAVALAAVPVTALGVLQYSLPKNHVLNKIEMGQADADGISRYGHVRATGTFTSVGGMGLMAGFTTWAGMFLVFPVAGRSRLTCLMGLATLACALLCAAVAMSRSGLVLWGITVAGGLVLYLRASQLFAAGLAILAVSMFVFSGDTSEDFEAFTQQDTLAKGIIGRVTEQGAFSDRASYIWDNLTMGVLNHPIGEGLGLGQPGGRYFASGSLKGAGYESEWGRIAFEVGPFGLLGVLAIRLAAGLVCWRTLRTTKDRQRRLVIATALPFFGAMCLAKMAFNHVGSTFAWFVITLALAAVMPINDRSARSTGGNDRIRPFG
jgi:hypothetical protein